MALNFPIELYTQIMGNRPNKYQKLSSLLESTEQGIYKGIQLSETMNAIKERRQRKQALAKIIQSVDFDSAAEQTGIPPELLKESMIRDMAGTMNLIAKPKKEESFIDEEIIKKKIGEAFDIRSEGREQGYEKEKEIRVAEQKQEELTQDKIRTVKTLTNTIGRMKTLLDSVPTASGIAGRAVGMFQTAKANAGMNPKLKVYNGYKGVVLGQIVKFIGGETGARLSDQDIARMREALPSGAGTTEERKETWKMFGNVVNDTSKLYNGPKVFDDKGNLLIEQKNKIQGDLEPTDDTDPLGIR